MAWPRLRFWSSVPRLCAGHHQSLHPCGSGPSTELDDDIGQHLGHVGQEFGTTTGRERRCSWFDAVAVRQAIQVSSISGLCLTKLDVLDGLKEVKICVAYELKDGTRVKSLTDVSRLDEATQCMKLCRAGMT